MTKGRFSDDVDHIFSSRLPRKPPIVGIVWVEIIEQKGGMDEREGEGGEGREKRTREGGPGEGVRKK